MKTSLQSFFKVLATHRVASTALRGRRWGQAVLRGAALLATVTAVCTGVGSNAHAQGKVRLEFAKISGGSCALRAFDALNPVICPDAVMHVPGTLTFTHTSKNVPAITITATDQALFVSKGKITTRAFRRAGTYTVTFTPMPNDPYLGGRGSANAIAVLPGKIDVAKRSRVQAFRFNLLPRD